MTPYSLGRSLAQPPGGEAAPDIRPNRTQLDNRFPVLAFTVYTGGRGYYEVLLTTDRGLFAANRATDRRPDNWYSSRQDGGLSATAGGSGVYVVPTAVLRGFAEAHPRPSAVYYAVAAYTSADGNSPAFSLAPEALPADAPSVSLGGGFRAQTLASVMGVATDMLRRVDQAARPPVSRPPVSRPLGLSPAEDAAAGEDGYGLSAGLWSDDPFEEAEVYAEDESAVDEPHANGFVYDDGLGDLPPAHTPRWGTAAGRGPAPAPLEDSEDDPDQEYADEVDRLDPVGRAAPPARSRSAAAYGDEGDEWQWPEEPPAYRALDDPPARRLEPADKVRVIERIAEFESSRDRYSAINADGEFEGRFRNHPAAGRYHVGLSFGVVQFTQDSGTLGQLLAHMRDRDRAAFDRIFGPSADELVRVTTAAGPGSADVPGGRSVRVQPVGGADLWREPWVSRFREAGRHAPFQAVQNQTAATLFLDPMLRFCDWFGLTSERALTIAVDRAVNMGLGGGRRWVAGAVGPVKSAAQRQQALAALGYADLLAFQNATDGLPKDNDWGPLSHAALTAALRGLGSRSPVAVPTLDQMLDAMVAAAHGQAWAHRVERLRTQADPALDVVFQLV